MHSTRSNLDPLQVILVNMDVIKELRDRGHHDLADAMADINTDEVMTIEAGEAEAAPANLYDYDLDVNKSRDEIDIDAYSENERAGWIFLIGPKRVERILRSIRDPNKHFAMEDAISDIKDEIGDFYVVREVHLEKKYRGKGLGLALYIKAAEEAGTWIVNDIFDETSSDAKKVWLALSKYGKKKSGIWDDWHAFKSR